MVVDWEFSSCKYQYLLGRSAISARKISGVLPQQKQEVASSLILL